MKTVKFNGGTYCLGLGAEIAPVLKSLFRKEETENRHYKYAEPYYYRAANFGRAVNGKYARYQLLPDRVYILSATPERYGCEFGISRVRDELPASDHGILDYVGAV